MTPEELALSLRVIGCDERQIRRRTGLRQPWKAIIAEVQRLDRESEVVMRGLQTARHERVLQALWPWAVPADPDQRPDMQAIRMVLATMRDQARLYGLSLPTQTNNVLVTQAGPVSPEDQLARAKALVNELQEQIQPIDMEEE